MSFIGLCQKQDVGICAFLGWWCKCGNLSCFVVFTVLSHYCTANSHLIPTMLLRPLHFFVWPGKMRWKSSPCSSAALPCEVGVVPWCWAVRWHFCMWEFFQHCCFSLSCFLGDAKASKPLVLAQARVLRLSWISGRWTIVWCFQHLRLEVEVSSLDFAMQIFP